MKGKNQELPHNGSMFCMVLTCETERGHLRDLGFPVKKSLETSSKETERRSRAVQPSFSRITYGTVLSFIERKTFCFVYKVHI